MGTGWDRTPLLPVPEGIPPAGKYKIVEMYVDPETGLIVVKYDNTPVK